MLSRLNNYSINSMVAFTAKKQERFSDNSEKPAVSMKIAIVDSFTQKTRDINGDGCPDLAHGEVVEAIAKGNLNYSPEIVRFDDKSDGGVPTHQNLLEIFKKVGADKSIKAVNVSIASSANLSEINEAYNFNSKLPENKNSINKETVFAKRNKVIECLLENESSTNLFKSVIKTLENIAKKKAVFIAAGNEMEGRLNVYNLAKGTIGVGSMATNDTSKPNLSYTKKSIFSGDNSALSVFSKGEYDITPIKKDGSVVGFDITEDGVVDVALSRIKGHNIVEHFVGNDIRDLHAPEKDYAKLKERQMAESWGVESDLTAGDIKRLSKKLYSLDKLLDYNIIDSETLSRNIKKGSYTDFKSALNMTENMYRQDSEVAADTPMFLFKVNSTNKIVYDPYVKVKNDESIGKLQGTSYATPTAFAEHVNSLIDKEVKNK